MCMCLHVLIIRAFNPSWHVYLRLSTEKHNNQTAKPWLTMFVLTNFSHNQAFHPVRLLFSNHSFFIQTSTSACCGMATAPARTPASIGGPVTVALAKDCRELVSRRTATAVRTPVNVRRPAAPISASVRWAGRIACVRRDFPWGTIGKLAKV